jgi:DNA-directed RNA polymerase subunit M/transcription elongation factor TFIIS
VQEKSDKYRIIYIGNYERKGEVNMVCKKCGSENIQVVQGSSKVKDVSILRTLGRWLLILCTAGLWLLVPKRKGTLKATTLAVCMNCGHKWKV